MENVSFDLHGQRDPCPARRHAIVPPFSHKFAVVACCVLMSGVENNIYPRLLSVVPVISVATSMARIPRR